MRFSDWSSDVCSSDRFAGEGARVMLVDVDGDRLAALARSIGEDRVDHVVADVADAAQVKGFVERTVARFGGVDIALLNAGIEGRVAPLLEQSDEDFDRVLAVNVRGVWLGLKPTMPAIARRGE